jgi:hypothetical protein
MHYRPIEKPFSNLTCRQTSSDSFDLSARGRPVGRLRELLGGTLHALFPITACRWSRGYPVRPLHYTFFRLPVLRFRSNVRRGEVKHSFEKSADTTCAAVNRAQRSKSRIFLLHYRFSNLNRSITPRMHVCTSSTRTRLRCTFTYYVLYGSKYHVNVYVLQWISTTVEAKASLAVDRDRHRVCNIRYIHYSMQQLR